MNMNFSVAHPWEQNVSFQDIERYSHRQGTLELGNLHNLIALEITRVLSHFIEMSIRGDRLVRQANNDLVPDDSRFEMSN